jgi:hypothetical protein
VCPIFSRLPYPRFLQKKIATFRNTSWGPIHSTIGDIIIIAAGCKIPLVLRPIDDGKFLFVGACWLIDSELVMDKSAKVDVKKESGYSPIMFGSACVGLPQNWTAEEFYIC